MKTVHKYFFTLPEEGHETCVEMPKWAEVLHVGVQHAGSVYLWAHVDTNQPREKRVFEVYGTGHDMTHIHDCVTHLKHLGTVFLRDGTRVFHIFERKHND